MHFNLCFMPGQRIINGLEERFNEDIFRKAYNVFGLEMYRSATSLTSKSRELLGSKMNRTVVSLASFIGNDSVYSNYIYML